jgi:hypothetical protein
VGEAAANWYDTLTGPQSNHRRPSSFNATRNERIAIDPAARRTGAVFPEPHRLRDGNHIRYIMKQPRLICGRQPRTLIDLP